MFVSKSCVDWAQAYPWNTNDSLELKGGYSTILGTQSVYLSEKPCLKANNNVQYLKYGFLNTLFNLKVSIYFLQYFDYSFHNTYTDIYISFNTLITHFITLMNILPIYRYLLTFFFSIFYCIDIWNSIGILFPCQSMSCSPPVASSLQRNLSGISIFGRLADIR